MVEMRLNKPNLGVSLGYIVILGLNVSFKY